jgi:hypothetical protein
VTKQDRDAIAQSVVAAMLEDPTAGIRGAAEAVGVSKSTLYRLMDSDPEMREQITAAQLCFRGVGSMLAELLGDDCVIRGRQPRAPLSENGRRAALANVREARAQAQAAAEAARIKPGVGWRAEAPRTPAEPKLAECDDSDFWRGILGR